MGELRHIWRNRRKIYLMRTMWNLILRRVGERHPMLPVTVWRGVGGWKWYGGYGIFNQSAIVRPEAPNDTENAEDGSKSPVGA